ncbi:MAG: Mov34/MPN/PAD-1 family protein [Gemmataceae bacterium]
MSALFSLQVPQAIVAQMLAQARAELPNECCGLLAGPVPEADQPARVAQCFPLVNAAASPREYWSESQAIFRAHRAMRHRGWERLAVYHSHPTSAPIPSKTDLERNGDGLSAMHFIISLAHPDQPELRAWWLGETEYWEAEWEIV